MKKCGRRFFLRRPHLSDQPLAFCPVARSPNRTNLNACHARTLHKTTATEATGARFCHLVRAAYNEQMALDTASRRHPDFVPDNLMLAPAAAFGFRIGDISYPTRYFAEASSINFRGSVIYMFGVLAMFLKFRLHRVGLRHGQFFSPNGKNLEVQSR